MNDSSALRSRANRVYLVTDYLYATGRVTWGHKWGTEWHRIASILAERGINIYVN